MESVPFHEGMMKMTAAMSISHTSCLALLVLVCFYSLPTIISATGLGRGFNDNIEWMNLENGLTSAVEQNKPIMLLIHKSWCGACKNLAPKFTASSDVEDMSENFIMVNVMDDEEPMDAKYRPDGGYIPRILFMSPNGEVEDTLYNRGGSDKYKYFYSDANSVVTSMKDAKSFFSSKTHEGHIDEDL